MDEVNIVLGALAAVAGRSFHFFGNGRISRPI